MQTEDPRKKIYLSNSNKIVEALFNCRPTGRVKNPQKKQKKKRLALEKTPENKCKLRYDTWQFIKIPIPIFGR